MRRPRAGSTQKAVRLMRLEVSPDLPSRSFLSLLIKLVAVVLVSGVLYFGHQILVPLALAALLNFLLAPACTTGNTLKRSGWVS